MSDLKDLVDSIKKEEIDSDKFSDIFKAAISEKIADMYDAVGKSMFQVDESRRYGSNSYRPAAKYIEAEERRIEAEEKRHAARLKIMDTLPSPVYYKVPYSEKDAAKAEGMKFDALSKKWFHTRKSKVAASKFEIDNDYTNRVTNRATDDEDLSSPVYYNVPYNDKDMAKAEGMKFDGELKKWYHTKRVKADSSRFPVDYELTKSKRKSEEE